MGSHILIQKMVSGSIVSFNLIGVVETMVIDYIGAGLSRLILSLHQVREFSSISV